MTSSSRRRQPHPCDGRDDPSTAGKTFADQRARAVVAEGVSLEDAHNTSLAALHELETKLTPKVPAAEAPMPLEVRTGNHRRQEHRESTIKQWCRHSQAAGWQPANPRCQDSDLGSRHGPEGRKPIPT